MPNYGLLEQNPKKHIDAWLNGAPVPPYTHFNMADSIYRPMEIEAFTSREEFIKHAGFAIPCAEALETLHSLSPLVEVGAGAGLWSRLLHMRGADIIATDPALAYSSMFQHGEHFPIEPLQAKTAVRRYRDRNVLLVWPSYDETWPTQMLKAMRIGRVLATVTEGESGCCANDEFFNILESFFEHKTTVNLPVFAGIHDRLTIWKKVRPYKRRKDQ